MENDTAMHVELEGMDSNVDYPQDNVINNNDVDDTPLFVGEGDAVEVQVDDTNVPMDDDDDDDGDDDNNNLELQDQDPIVDMAKWTLSSHSDPVYAVACALDTTTTTTLRIVSGGGDDKAFWHDIPMNITQPQAQPQAQSTSLESHHQFKDSVSTVASNTPFLAFQVDKTSTRPPNPEWMAVGGLDGSVVLFGPGGRVLPLQGPSSDIEWLCWHPKGGNVLLVGSSDATIWMFHTSLNKCLQVFVGHEDTVTCGAFSPDGKLALSASADGTLRIWAPKTGKSKHVFRFTNANTAHAGPPPALTCLATHGGTDQQLVIVGGEDGQAHVCHVANKKQVASLKHFDPTLLNNNSSNNDNDDQVMVPSEVEAVGFCKSNPNWCATGGIDGVLKIWDLSNQGQCRHACRINQNENEQTTDTINSQLSGDGITKLQWHPTLPLVLTATCRGQVHLWDARNGQRIHTLTGHADVINDMDVLFSTSTTSTGGAGAGKAVIVTASDDKTVKVFHLDIDTVMALPQLS